MGGSFVGMVIGLMASMLGLLGAVAILFLSVGGAGAIHWSFGFGLLLIPIWLATAIKVMDWSFDL